MFLSFIKIASIGILIDILIIKREKRQSAKTGKKSNALPRTDQGIYNRSERVGSRYWLDYLESIQKNWIFIPVK